MTRTFGPLCSVPKPKREPKHPKPAFGKGQRAKRSGGHLFEKHVSESRRAFIRKQCCIATGVRTGEWVLAQSWMPETLKALCPYKARIVPAHVKSRGSSGPDSANMVPIEWMLHDWLGQIGQTAFERRVKLMPLGEIAAEFERKFLARTAAQSWSV